MFPKTIWYPYHWLRAEASDESIAHDLGFGPNSSDAVLRVIAREAMRQARQENATMRGGVDEMFDALRWIRAELRGLDEIPGDDSYCGRPERFGDDPKASLYQRP